MCQRPSTCALPYLDRLHISSVSLFMTHSKHLLLQEHAPKYSHLVAVVDPPRAGLHRNVLRALLACKELKRLVFVSCNPDSLVLNAGLLCGRYMRDWPVGSRSKYLEVKYCCCEAMGLHCSSMCAAGRCLQDTLLQQPVFFYGEAAVVVESDVVVDTICSSATSGTAASCKADAMHLCHSKCS